MPRNTFSVSALNSATPGLSKLAMALGGGQGTYQQGYDHELGTQSKLAAALAQMRNADASARNHDASARQTDAETNILSTRPAQFEEQVANSAGTNVPLVQAIRQTMRTGQAPQVPMGPPTENGSMGVGSQTFDPAVQSKVAQAIKQFAPLLFNQKDIKPDDMAQADAIYRKGGLADAIIAGTADRNVVGGAQAAVEGKPLFHAGEFGSTDQFTGGVDASGAPAQRFGKFRDSATAENVAQAGSARAAAGAHNASADNSRASAAKTRMETDQGAKGVLQQTDQGLMLVNPRAATATPVLGPDGQPMKPAGKPLPEAAQKQVVGTRNLQDAIGEYQMMLMTWSNRDMLNPNRRAEMGRAYNNMMLQAKEAYNLGVLNGPDYDILQSVVKDPTNWQSVTVSNDALGAQAEALKNTAANIERTVLEAHGKPYTPRPGKAPAQRPPLESFNR